MFILHAPAKVVCAPNLQYPCINMFRLLFHDRDASVRLRCVQTIESIFLRPNRAVSAPYVHALAPRIVEFLFSDEPVNVSADEKYLVVRECLRTVVLLLSVCVEGTRELSRIRPPFFKFKLLGIDK
jgi:hypothetical protein